MTMNITSQPVVALFSGQGNPVIGMGSDLWDLNDAAKQIWDCASDISGINLRRLCLKGPMNRLVQTTVQQLAVTAINVTLYTLCRERYENMRIIGSCGHSVGEYSALYAAGAISLETLFRTIHFRASTMHEESQKHKGSMLALKGVDYATLCEIVARSGIALDISCDNSPSQQVIGGSPAALSEFSQVLLAKGLEPVKLGVSGAWHTRLMSEGVQLMRDFLAAQAFHPAQHQVIMNVTGQTASDSSQMKENLSLHLTHTVKWTDTMTHFLNGPADSVFLEISNKPYLGQMLNDYAGFDPERLVHCRKALAN